MIHDRKICCNCKFWIEQYVKCTKSNTGKYDTETCKYFSDKVDWEQRRYEIAKECMAANISIWRDTYNYANSHEKYSEDIYTYTAKCALEYTDALIKELKNNKL